MKITCSVEIKSDGKEIKKTALVELDVLDCNLTNVMVSGVVESLFSSIKKSGETEQLFESK